MSIYEVDGVEYEIDDGVDIHQAVAGIRASGSHQDAVTKRGPSMTQAIGENVKGAITAAGDLVGAIPGMIAGPVYGGLEWLKTGDARKGLEAFQATSEALNPLSPEFSPGIPGTDIRGSALPGTEALIPDRETGAYHNIMWPFEQVAQAGGKLAGAAAYYGGGSPETIERAGAAGDLVTAAAFSGLMARGGAKTVTRVKEAAVAREKAAYDKKVAEAEAKLRAAEEQRKQDFQRAQQTELFEGEQVHPAERSPYRIPDQERAALEAELNGPRSRVIEGEIPVEERTPGHGELFSEFARPEMTRDALDRLPGGRSARERPETLDTLQERGLLTDPWVTEQMSQAQARDLLRQERGDLNASENLTGRGARELVQNKQLEDLSYDVAGIKEQLTAVQKPGFQRDAVEMMLAREFEKDTRPSFPDPFQGEVKLDRILGGPGKKQGGAIYVSPHVSQAIRRTVNYAFNAVKRNWPRFAENTDIFVYGNPQWRRYVKKQIDAGMVHYTDINRFQSGEVPLFYDGKTIHVNADSSFIKNKSIHEIAGAFAHELRHGIQDQRGSFDKWGKDHPDWQRPPHERIWEKQAITAAKLARKRAFFKARGSIDPDALTTKPSWEAFKKQAAEIFGSTKYTDSELQAAYKAIHGNKEAKAPIVDYDVRHHGAMEPEKTGKSYAQQMREGTKPATLIESRQQSTKELDQLVKEGLVTRHRFGQYTVYTLKGESRRALEIKDALLNEKNHETKSRRVGAALGYKPEQIDSFWRHQNRLRDGEWVQAYDHTAEKPHWIQQRGDRIYDYYGDNPLDAPVGPKSQRGGWTPFASSKKGPTFEDFKREMRNRGHAVSDEVLKALWKGDNNPTKPEKLGTPTTTERAKAAIDKVPGLAKETKDLYIVRPLAELKAELNTLYEAEGARADLWIGGNAFAPRAYDAKRHPITRWVNAWVNHAKNEATKWQEKLQIGEQVSRRGTREIAPDSPQGRWIKLTSDEQGAIAKLSWELTNKNVRPTPEAIREVLGRELSPREAEALQDVQNVSKAVLDVINAHLRDRGLTELPERNFYGVPALRKGNYIVHLKDKNGKLIESIGTWVRPDSRLGRLLQRNLQNKLKELGIELDPASIVRKASPEQMSLASLEALMRRGTDPAVRAAIDEVMAEFSFRRARTMQRKGIKGAEGSEGTVREQVRGFEEAMDYMVDQAARLKSNLDIAKAYREFADSPEIAKFPNARRVALKHFDLALGDSVKVFKALDAFIADALHIAGLPPNLIAKAVNVTGNVSVNMLMAFILMSQLLIQLPQHMITVPKLFVEFGQGVTRNPLVTTALIADTYLQAMRDMVLPRGDIMQQLGLEGTFSPVWRREYGGYQSEIMGSRRALRIYRHLTGQTALEWMESNVVRKPAGLIVYHALKKLGLEGRELIEATKNLTEDYMVAMDKHKKAPAISRTGVFGDFFGRLQNFPLTWIAQFFENVGALKNFDVMPIASWLAISYALTGMLGMLGVREADAVIDYINSKTGAMFKTASDLIFEWTAKSDNQFVIDQARYGMVSALTGMSFSGQFAAPTIMSSGPPALSLLEGITGVAEVLLAEAFGDETQKRLPEEKREAWKKMTPRSAHPFLEEDSMWSRLLGTKGPTDKMTNAKGKAVIERTDFDRVARLLGTFSLSEAEAKRTEYLSEKRQRLEREERGKFLKRLTVHLLEGNSFNATWADRAKKLGYTDSGQISKGLRDHIVDRYLPYEQREFKSVRTPQQQRAYLLFKSLGGTDRELMERANAQR